MVSIHAPREGCDGYKAITELRHNGFNSRTPGGVRRRSSDFLALLLHVSIHAPREGCDPPPSRSMMLSSVSIHAPREGCDSYLCDKYGLHSKFQFTHPGRGATSVPRNTETATPMFQFTHPGRGATTTHRQTNLLCGVSIHAPREGCDHRWLLWRRPHFVSIHAPREGCDGTSTP